MREPRLTGAPDLVLKMDSSVEEKTKAWLAFAVANLAFTKDGNVSSKPSCIIS